MAINNILIVDDNSAHLAALEQALPKGYSRLIKATSGKQALELAISERPDIVFLDVVMDELDGYAVCRSIKQNPDTKNIPVVFVSTKDQRADQLWAKKLGALALLVKPVTSEQIEKVLLEAA